MSGGGVGGKARRAQAHTVHSHSRTICSSPWHHTRALLCRWVNTWLHRDLRTPFGGMKDSGVGREGGQHSLDFYSEAKNTCVYIPKE